MVTKKSRILLGLSLVLLTSSGAAFAQGRPLSAIDWLSDTVARPAPPAGPRPDAPIKPLGELDKITTSTLSNRQLDGVGVLPIDVTGFDKDYWTGSMMPRLTELISAEQRAEPLPALRDLIQTLMLAELAPPLDADGSGQFLLVRIDRLLAFGALEAAYELVEAARPLTPDLFRRSFDISLLMATENAACAEQRATPRISPTVSARIFCLARGGDWQAAELTLGTSRALGRITPEEDALLSRFLDPELYEDEAPLPPPERLTPLVLRMYEAIGEPISSTALPLAFAHGDLTPASGWKARLEAAERLARVGAIAPSQLFSIYTERKRAASGGVWERVGLVHDLEAALAKQDTVGLTKVLPKLWAAMADLELEQPFAETYGAKLQAIEAPAEIRSLIFRIGLLSRDYELVAEAYETTDIFEAYLAGIATGHISGITPPDGLAYAIAPVFAGSNRLPELSRSMQDLIKSGRKGEAALIAIDKVMTGVHGDLRAVTEGLAILRQLGLEAAARRAALQLLLLERRG